MGSFLQTCSITNQSIQESETVYVVPIIENIENTKIGDNKYARGLNAAVYNTDMFKPLGFIFIGYYNDYGQYAIDWERVENRIMFKHYFEYLNQNSIAVEEGENSCHDIPFDISNLTLDNNYEELWEKIHEAIWEGRLFLINNKYLPEQPQNFCKVHYHVSIKSHSDILINLYNEANQKSDKYRTKEINDFYKLEVIDQAKFYIDNLFEYNFNKDFNKENFRITYLENRVGPYMSCGSFLYYWSFYDFIKKIREENIDKDSLIPLYMLLNNLKIMTIAMSHCNLIYRPTYYGTQDYSNSLGNRFCYLMSKVHEHNIQERLESWYDEEEYTESELVSVMEQEAIDFDY